MADTTSLGQAKPIRESYYALPVELLDDATGETVWVPKSQIADESECYSMKSGEGELIVTAWWARMNGYGD